MKINRVYLDLDDVLNCFVPYTLSALGCKCRMRNYSDYPVEAGWDLVKAFNLLRPELYTSISKDQFWYRVDINNIWKNVPKSKEFNLLLKLSQQLVARDNIFILTAPSYSPCCLSGKLEWIQKYCPKWLRRQYIITPRKYVCAQKGSLLIDDNEDNCRQFRNHGGETIIFPRPWNSYRNIFYKNISKHIEAMFELYEI